MEKIEIGEYVRTTKGYILKNTIEEHKHILDNYSEYIGEFGDIEKHCKDIIYLIKEGDYVNNSLVIRIFSNVITVITRYGLQSYSFKDIINNKSGSRIENIVTKELFESIKYRG